MFIVTRSEARCRFELRSALTMGQGQQDDEAATQLAYRAGTKKDLTPGQLRDHLSDRLGVQKERTSHLN